MKNVLKVWGTVNLLVIVAYLVCAVMLYLPVTTSHLEDVALRLSADEAETFEKGVKDAAKDAQVTTVLEYYGSETITQDMLKKKTENIKGPYLFMAYVEDVGKLYYLTSSDEGLKEVEVDKSGLLYQIQTISKEKENKNLFLEKIDGVFKYILPVFVGLDGVILLAAGIKYQKNNAKKG